MALDVIRVRGDIREYADTEPVRGLPVATPAPASTFEMLGFDAGWLRGQHSILWQPGFMDEADAQEQLRWAAQLNVHGLFGDIAHAGAFRDAYHLRRPETPDSPAFMHVLEVPRYQQ